MGELQGIVEWKFPLPAHFRYGEHSTPFCVSAVDSSQRGDREFSRRIHDAVERASLDIPSGTSSDEEDGGGDNSMSSSSGSSSNLSALCSAPAPPTNPEPKTIPTVSNPNSVYRVGSKEKRLQFLPCKLYLASSHNFFSCPPQFSEFSPGAPQNWLREKRKPFPGEAFSPGAPLAEGPVSQFSGQKGFKPYRATFTFTGPRVDKYHWVSKSRS